MCQRASVTTRWRVAKTYAAHNSTLCVVVRELCARAPMHVVHHPRVAAPTFPTRRLCHRGRSADARSPVRPLPGLLSGSVAGGSRCACVHL
eukprot:11182249-Lingulodinium_polyedra.AAC.1